VTYEVVAGRFPIGVRLVTNSVVVRGTPRKIGVYRVSIRATDCARSHSDWVRFVVTVKSARRPDVRRHRARPCELLGDRRPPTIRCDQQEHESVDWPGSAVARRRHPTSADEGSPDRPGRSWSLEALSESVCARASAQRLAGRQDPGQCPVFVRAVALRVVPGSGPVVLIVDRSASSQSPTAPSRCSLLRADGFGHARPTLSAATANPRPPDRLLRVPRLDHSPCACDAAGENETLRSTFTSVTKTRVPKARSIPNAGRVEISTDLAHDVVSSRRATPRLRDS
jgi:hypothetical protein